MATTYGQLQADIADDLSRSDLTTQIQKAIKRAIAFYQSDPFWFNEAQATTPTVQGQEFYPLPTDFQKPISLAIYDPNSATTVDLAKKPNSWINAHYTTALQGKPSVWSVLADEFRIRNLPDATAYILTLTYNQSYVVLSAPADTNNWLDEGEDLIRFRAEWDVYANTIKDLEMASAALAQAKEQRESLRRQSALIKRTPHLGTEIPASRQSGTWSILTG